MPNETNLGRLSVDMEMDTSPLRKGMTQARGILTSGIKSMQGLISKLRIPLMAIGAAITLYLGRAFSNFVGQQKNLAIMQNAMGKLAKGYKRSLGDMQMEMLRLAKTTGVSSEEQTAALGTLFRMLKDFTSTGFMQDVLLPIAIDWAYVSGKSPEDAAQDIAEAFLGEAPEELLMPVKIKWEEENPGKSFDDLTRAEKWKLIEEYLKGFQSSAEAASRTIWGAFKRINTALQEIFNAMADSADFTGFIAFINDLGDSLFNLAEDIRSGNSPQWLRDLMNSIQGLMEKIKEFVTNGGLADLIDNLPKIGAALLALMVADKVTPAIGGMYGILKDFGGFIAGLIGGGLLVTLGKQMFTFFFNLFKATESGTALHGLSVVMSAFFRQLATGGGVIAAFKAGFAALATVLGVSAGVLAAGLAAITAGIIAFVLAWKNNWGGLRDETKEMWQGVVDTFVGLWENTLKPFFGDIYDTISDIVAMFGIKLPELEEFFKILKDGIGRLLEQMKDTIGSLFTAIIDTIGFAFKTLGNAFGVFLEVVRVFMNTWGAILETLVALITFNFDEIDNIWGEWFEKLKGSGANIVKYVGDFVGDFIEWLASLVENIKDMFFGGIKAFFNFEVDIRGLGEKINQTVHNWTTGLVDKVRQMKDNAIQKTSEFVTGLFQFKTDSDNAWSGVNGSTGAAVLTMNGHFLDLVTKIGSRITEFVGKIGEMKTRVSTAITELASAIGEKFSAIVSTVSNKIEDMLDAVTNFTSRFKTAGKGLIDALWDGVTSKFNAFMDWFKAQLAKIRNLLPGSDAKEGPLSTLTKAGKGLFSAMQDGMMKQAPNFLSAVEGIASQTAGLLPDGSGLTPSMAGAQGGAINVYVSNSIVTNEKDMDRLADEINRRLGRR